MPDTGTDPGRVRPLVVDVSNVMGARPDGWWRDRRAAAQRLLDEIAGSDGLSGVAVIAVLDPHRWTPEPSAPGITIVHAPRSADDSIVEIVRAHPDPASVTVVTSDRGLRARVRDCGASVVGARWLLDRLEDAPLP